MGGIASLLGIDPTEQNFNYNVSQSSYNPNDYLTGGITDLKGIGSRFGGQATNMFQRSDDFLDPNSQWSRDQASALREGVGDTTAQSLNQANTSLAQRGMGGGGMAGLLGNILSNRGGEQIRQGQRDIRNQGVGYAGQFAGLGMQGLGGAAGAYGQAGQLGSAIDARTLQNEQWNKGQLNQQSQYANQMDYRQTQDNKQARAAFANSMLGLVGGMAGSYLGGPMAAATLLKNKP